MFNYRVVKFLDGNDNVVDEIEYVTPMTPRDREALKTFLALNYMLTPDGKAEVIKYNR